MSDFKVFEYMAKHKYEQVVHFYDEATGLRGITVIHDTTLGPALGGTRVWNYESEEAALIDCLRLSRGMTYKAAAAGLNLGGGKTVVIGNHPEPAQAEAFFRALGRYIQGMGGRYITAEDVNTSTSDMSFVHMETDYVVGLEGKSGNPSPFTAKGAFYGIKAALKYKFNDSEISKYSYAVQGVGATGTFLIDYLLEEGAKKIYACDINEKHIAALKKKHPEVIFVKPEEIYSVSVDVFAPCALGGILNSQTIPQLKATIVAGIANNVLLDEEVHGPMLREKGILYAPDFVINAGGLINVYNELIGYKKENVEVDLKRIYDRLLDIFKIADSENISTQEAAKVFAKKRIEQIKNIHSNYIKK